MCPVETAVEISLLNYFLAGEKYIIICKINLISSMIKYHNNKKPLFGRRLLCYNVHNKEKITSLPRCWSQ